MSGLSQRKNLARGLAFAFLAGPWHLPGLLERGAEALQLTAPSEGLKRLARLALRLYREHPLGRADALSRLLARSHALRQARQEERATFRDIRHWLVPELAMARPWAAFATLELPRIVSERELADFVGILPDDLDWFADPKRLNRATRAARLRHYDYRWVAKRSGAFRLIEAPKRRLKEAQRRILDGILNRVPLHEACHGHRPGRSVTTFVAPHVGQELVLALDLAEFFVSVREVRVRILFEALGYPDRVAATLAALCCTPTPEDVLKACPLPRDASPAQRDEAFLQRRKLRDAHLPQGAPTSPALANLSAFRLDLRLSALARKLGAHYTRYADDLAFSGDAHFRAVATKALPRIGAIVLEEGFQLRYRKTRTMSESQRQRLCGVVVNRAPSLPRKELELLEAILFNCIRSGPTSQNREHRPDFHAHLRGRIAWVTQLHPQKGAYLSELFERIAFGADEPPGALRTD